MCGRRGGRGGRPVPAGEHLAEDIELLNEMVRTLRKRGYRRVSKSQIIRYALKTADLEKMPQSY